MIDVSPGLGPEILQGPGTNSGGVVAYPSESYQSPLLDLAQACSIELVPGRPNHVPVMAATVWVIESLAGTQTVPPTVKAGSNPAHNNFIQQITTSPSNATVNAALPRSIIVGPSIIVQNVQRFPGQPVFFDVSVPAVGTGGYRCMYRFTAVLYWLAVDGI